MVRVDDKRVLPHDARPRAPRGPLRRRFERRGRGRRAQVRTRPTEEGEHPCRALRQRAKYLSKIFNDDWMRENGFLEETGLGMVADLLKDRQERPAHRGAGEADRVRDVIARMKAHGHLAAPRGRRRQAARRRRRGRPAPLPRLGRAAPSTAPSRPLVESDYATVSPDKHRTAPGPAQRREAWPSCSTTRRSSGVVTKIKIDLIDWRRSASALAKSARGAHGGCARPGPRRERALDVIEERTKRRGHELALGVRRVHRHEQRIVGVERGDERAALEVRCDEGRRDATPRASRTSVSASSRATAVHARSAAFRLASG
jgi:hypothetical protein